MIEQGIRGFEKRIKALGNESVHGLPLDWPEQPKRVFKPRSKRHRDTLLGTQNVHGLPTSWDGLDLSE